MSNEKCFKCLVQLNDLKYLINSVYNNNDITFDIVLKEIQIKINPNLSLKTHWFEIFDTDFKEYVLITSHKQIIENLSRIRVLPKSHNISYDGIGISNFTSTEESNISTTSSINTLNENFSIGVNSNTIQTQKNNCIKYENNINNEVISVSTKSKDINNEKVLNNEEVAKSSSNKSVIKSPRPKLFSNSISSNNTDTNFESKLMINYFGPNILNSDRRPNSSKFQFETTVEKFGKISTVILKFSAEDINAYKILLQIMTQNIDLFKADSSKVALNDSWIVSSEQMIRNGFNEWSALKCMDTFIGSVSLYKKVLESTSNYEAASKAYPLFHLIHSFDLNYFIRPKKLKNIMDLREEFELENDKKEKNMNSKQNLIDKKLIVANTNANQTQIRTSICTSTSKNANKLKPNELKENHSIKAASKLSDTDIKAFHTMIAVIYPIAARAGISSDYFWKLMSKQMKLSGYREYDAKKCEKTFKAYVGDYYKWALILCPDYETACSVYPLFDFIYRLNLEPLLSKKVFKKIDENRREFDKRIGKHIETEPYDKPN